MLLKPQDVFVMLKLVALGRRPWSYAWLSVELSLSSSQIHSAIKRALRAKLAIKKEDEIIPNIRNLEEFLIHGLKYVFVPDRGELVRGIPTSYAALPMKSYFMADYEPPPVWPDPEGEVRGVSFSPLYKSATKAVKNDSKFYELLVLIDAIRDGRVREQELAKNELWKRLKQYE